MYHRTPEGFVPYGYDGLDAVIPLEAIGTDLALKELYERVDFASATRELDDEADELGVSR